MPLAALNPQQQQAVTHGAGPLLVIAGAGTGKTRVIIHRIAHLLNQGVAAEKILGVTFTNKAAGEMRERLAAAAGPAARAVTLGTFHALGLMILQSDPAPVGLRPGFAVYDTSDQLSLLREIMRQVRVADRRLDARRLLEMILASKRAGHEDFALTWGDDYELAAYDLYPRYIAQMRAFNAVDFDDLIGLSLRVLGEAAGARRWAGRWQAFVLDEYQDTSAEQLEMVRRLSAPTFHVCAVGDDDQSIYAWRGAAADNIATFAARFPGARRITLEENYRCTRSVLAAANLVIAAGREGPAKTLWTRRAAGAPVEVVACRDDQDEAAFVAEQLAAWTAAGEKLRDAAVLYRSNVQGTAVEEALKEASISYRVVGGQAFFDRKEVRDVLALMGAVQSQDNEVAVRRVVNVPPRGLGPESLRHLTAWAHQHQCSLYQALEQAQRVPNLTAAARQGAQAFVALVARHRGPLHRASGAEARAALAALVAEFGLREAVVAADDSPSLAARRLENLAEMQDAYGRYAQREGAPAAPLAPFLRAHALGHRRADAKPEDQEAVTLMTLHGAKGLEFARVLLIGAEEDLLPHRKTLDEGGDLGEERRLTYVGITRARRQLSISWARQRGQRGRRVPRSRSRFLADIEQLPEVVARCRGDGDGQTGLSPAAAHFFTTMRAHLGLPADG